MSKIEVIVCECGKKPYLKTIDDNLREYQKIVGGYIEVVSFYDDEGNVKLVICNEEGVILGLKSNCLICDQPFFGNVIIASRNGEEFGSVEPNFLERFINKFWKTI